MSARIGVRLQLEHADRVPSGEQLEHGGVVERDGVDVERRVLGGADHLDRVRDHVEVAQPEEVHLQQAEVLDAVHLVLRDDRRRLRVLARLGLALDREVVGERLLGDDDRGGVDAVLAAQTLEAQGHVDDLLHVGVGVAHRPQVAAAL